MKKLHLKLPTTWNELSSTQLENVAFQLECYHFAIRDNSIAENELRTRLYIAVAKEFLRGNSMRAIRYALKELVPVAYKEYVQFVFETNDRTVFKESLKINKDVYYGPAIRMRNITIAELSFADSLYYHWKQTFNVAYLNTLCATLYRQTNNEATEYDKRKPFNKLLVDANAQDFAKIPYKTKLAIAYTYEGCRNHLAKTYTAVFPKREPNQQTLKSEYAPFGTIVLDKIKGDPSKLKDTQNLLATEFLSIYNKDIQDLK